MEPYNAWDGWQFAEVPPTIGGIVRHPQAPYGYYGNDQWYHRTRDGTISPPPDTAARDRALLLPAAGFP